LPDALESTQCRIEIKIFRHLQIQRLRESRALRELFQLRSVISHQRHPLSVVAPSGCNAVAPKSNRYGKSRSIEGNVGNIHIHKRNVAAGMLAATEQFKLEDLVIGVSQLGRFKGPVFISWTEDVHRAQDH